MLRLAADENFNNNIIRGLTRRMPEMNIVRVQDAELSGVDDPNILEWAASENRIFLTHDVSTMTFYAYERIRTGQPMPGLIGIHWTLPLHIVIEDVLLLVRCSLEGKYEGQVMYLPLK